MTVAKEPLTLIDASEVAARQSSGTPVELIDVRTPAEFASIHAKGARLVPLDQLDVASVLASRASSDEPIYLLCKSGGRASKAREKFANAGFANAVVVEGGTDAWVRAGLPVVRGTAMMSLERQVRIAAGSLMLIGIILGWTVHPGFFGLSAFIGAGLVVSGITDTCGMGMMLAKMPWNRRG